MSIVKKRSVCRTKLFIICSNVSICCKETDSSVTSELIYTMIYCMSVIILFANCFCACCVFYKVSLQLSQSIVCP